MPFGKIPRSLVLAEQKKTEQRICQRTKKLIVKGREHKYTNPIYSALQVPWGGNFYELCVPTVGTADTQRIGDRITPMSINYLLRITSASSDVYNMVRLIIIQAHETNFVVATDITTILSTVSATYAPESQFNHDNRKKYTVLYDQLRQISSSVGPSSTIFRGTIRRKMRPIQFIASGVTTVSGGLYMIAISDSQATIHPDITGTVRVEYTDA